MLSLPGRACDVERAGGVHIAFGVAVEIQLDPAEQGRRLDVAGDVCIRHRVHEACGFRPGGVGAVRLPSQRLGNRQCRERGGRERRISELPRGSHSPFRRLEHVVVARTPEGAHSQVDQQRHGFRRAQVVKLRDSTGETGACLLMPADKSLDRGAAADELGSQSEIDLGRKRDCLQHRLVAVGEAARRRQGLSAREEELGPLVGRSGHRQEAERFSEPAGGASGRQPDRLFTCLAEDGDGVHVTLPCGTRDMVCPRCRGEALGRQCVGASFVGAQAPSG